MGGWVDGLVDGWIVGWMDCWMDGLLDGWIVGWMDGWMDGLVYEWIDGARPQPLQMLLRCYVRLLLFLLLLVASVSNWHY